jgi:hypothetical protein
LRSNEDWATYYRSLTTEPHTPDPSEIINMALEEFLKSTQNTPHDEIRKAFLTTTAGQPGLPVHYPRVRPLTMKANLSMPTPPDPRGRSYEWFTANEETKKQQNMESAKKLAEHRRSLPPVHTDGRDLVIYQELPAKD